jgi:hypothetical protein
MKILVGNGSCWSKASRVSQSRLDKIPNFWTRSLVTDQLQN